MAVSTKPTKRVKRPFFATASASSKNSQAGHATRAARCTSLRTALYVRVREQPKPCTLPQRPTRRLRRQACLLEQPLPTCPTSPPSLRKQPRRALHTQPLMPATLRKTSGCSTGALPTTSHPTARTLRPWRRPSLKTSMASAAPSPSRVSALCTLRPWSTASAHHHPQERALCSTAFSTTGFREAHHAARVQG